MAAESPTAQVRRAILAAVRDPASVVSLSPVELDFTIRVMRRARLLGRLAWQLREAALLERLPLVAVDALAGALANCEARARAALWEMDRLAWALRDLPDVPLVALKGCAYLLAGMPLAKGRLFADVDLLMPESRIGEVEARLQAHGWRSRELTPYDENYYRVWAHELPPLVHAEREMEVDLHHNIVMRTARIRPDAGLLIGSSRLVPGGPFRVLQPVDLVLHAMTHLFHAGDVEDGIRDLIDIDLLLRHGSQRDTTLWEQFWPRARELQLARPAWYGLRTAIQWLGAPVPAQVKAEARAHGPLRPVGSLMDRLLPLALLPCHPDRSSGWATRTARLSLLVRSHWLRMPPGLLARHLIRKTAVRYLGTEQKPR